MHVHGDVVFEGGDDILLGGRDAAQAKLAAEQVVFLVAGDVMHLAIPPLRERKEDLWPLVESLVRKQQPALAGLHFSPQVRTLFERYDWPGNVRELENVLVNILSRMSGGCVTVGDLPETFAATREARENVDLLKDTEQRMIAAALVQCNNNVSKAAKVLGISRATLYRKLKKTA